MSFPDRNGRHLTLWPVAATVSSRTMGQVASKKARATPIANSTLSYPIAANGDSTVQGSRDLSRRPEDWRTMRNPAKRYDPIDALKFIPLDRAGDSYLTLSGELRLRVQETTNPNLRRGQHFRAYGEIALAGLGGVNVGTSHPNLKNDLMLQQASGEVMDEINDVTVDVCCGREEFIDGPNLLTLFRYALATTIFGNTLYYSDQLFLTPTTLAVIASNPTIQPTRSCASSANMALPGGRAKPTPFTAPGSRLCGHTACGRTPYRRRRPPSGSMKHDRAADRPRPIRASGGQGGPDPRWLCQL